MSDKLKVLMFGWEFPPYAAGGLGMACYGLVKAMRKRPLDLTLILPKSLPWKMEEGVTFFGADTWEYELATGTRKQKWNGIRTIKIDSELEPYASMAPVPWQIHKLSRDALEQVSTHQSKQLEGVQTPNPHDDLYGLDLMEAVEKYNRTAASVAASLDFDVIHCHDWMTFGAGIIAKQISGKPLVCQVHATEFDRCPGYGNREVHEIEQAGCLVADRVIAVSSYTKKLLVDRYGVSDNKIEIVHNGIELQPDVPSPQPVHSDQPPRILFLGRVTYQKGPNYFIEAAKKVLQVRPDARFVIAGKGDMLDYIKARAGELAILNNLEFVGLLTPEEVQRIYRSVDCFVLSSVSEPFGLTVLEALSQRLPVILSRQSGVSEVLRHVLRYDYWDVDRLASLILSVVSYSPLASELREKGIDDLHPVSWDRSAERIHGIYAGAVGKI